MPTHSKPVDPRVKTRNGRLQLFQEIVRHVRFDGVDGEQKMKIIEQFHNEATNCLFANRANSSNKSKYKQGQLKLARMMRERSQTQLQARNARTYFMVFADVDTSGFSSSTLSTMLYPATSRVALVERKPTGLRYWTINMQRNGDYSVENGGSLPDDRFSSISGFELSQFFVLPVEIVKADDEAESTIDSAAAGEDGSDGKDDDEGSDSADDSDSDADEGSDSADDNSDIDDDCDSDADSDNDADEGSDSDYLVEEERAADKDDSEGSDSEEGRPADEDSDEEFAAMAEEAALAAEAAEAAKAKEAAEAAASAAVAARVIEATATAAKAARAAEAAATVANAIEAEAALATVAMNAVASAAIEAEPAAKPEEADQTIGMKRRASNRARKPRDFLPACSSGEYN